MKEPSQTSGTLWGVCTFALLADSTPGLSCVLQEAMCICLLPWTELCRAADSLFFYIYTCYLFQTVGETGGHECLSSAVAWFTLNPKVHVSLKSSRLLK